MTSHREKKSAARLLIAKEVLSLDDSDKLAALSSYSVDEQYGGKMLYIYLSLKKQGRVATKICGNGAKLHLGKDCNGDILWLSQTPNQRVSNVIGVSKVTEEHPRGLEVFEVNLFEDGCGSDLVAAIGKKQSQLLDNLFFFLRLETEERMEVQVASGNLSI
ncbi:hypothetical protein [Vibrio crassostreae]|uniref:hypothetical protein n=1 Tax=Vibrio crassostreae TaxID=246167 RepID=UPI001B3144D5|nr:hypothetical protein [Vibrio crassostreae]